MRTFWVTLVGMLLSTAAWAQMPNFADSKTYRDCMDRVYDHGFVTENQISCIKAELKKYDALLNSRYQVLLKMSEGPDRQKLVQAQREWVKFRDAWCGFEFTVTEVAPNIYVKRELCLTELTVEQWYRLKTVR